MNLSKINRLFLASMMLVLFAFSFSDHLSKSLQKKVDKELSQIWPDTEIAMFKLVLDDENLKRSTEIGLEHIYQLLDDANVVGYMAHAKVPSKFDDFDIAIFYDTTFSIKSMKVLAYREDHGGEVGSKRWLKQFCGKNASDPLTLNDDIQGISGATISCVSATIGAKEITQFISTIDLY